MSATLGFLVFLILTLALLGGAFWTGFAHRRRTHLALVISALASLGITIVYATRLGRLYDLEAAGPITPIHLFIAKVTTAAYLLPIASGIRLWFRPGSANRGLHRKLAYLVLALTLLTAGTGTAMVLLAERLPAEAALDHGQPAVGTPQLHDLSPAGTLGR